MRLPAASLSLFVAASGWAQTPASPQAPAAQLDAPGLNQICTRLVQLMEAGGFAVPALAHAAAPLIDDVKSSCAQIRARPGAGEPAYSLILNVGAYIDLADAVPKPFPFPDVARQQFAEVRDHAARLDVHFRALLEAKEASLREPDRDQVAHYQEQNRLVPPPAAGGRRTVFLGDTVTAQWRINEYFPEEDFYNRGIEGQITGQMLGRMKADVVDLQPAAVVIQGGTFDLTREIPLTAIEDNYVSMADIAAAYNIKLIFASVLPVSDYHKSVNPSYERSRTRPLIYIRALNEWLKALCVQRGYTYADVYSVLADETGALMADVSDDGLIPNAKGYRLMAPVLAEAIQEATRPAVAPPKPATRRR